MGNVPNKTLILMKRLIAKVYGDVQGVGFRYEVKRRADDLGLTGFVRNEPDGTVDLEAEGEERELEKLLNWCRNVFDPKLVEKVSHYFSDEIKWYKNFSIK